MNSQYSPRPYDRKCMHCNKTEVEKGHSFALFPTGYVTCGCAKLATLDLQSKQVAIFTGFDVDPFSLSPDDEDTTPTGGFDWEVWVLTKIQALELERWSSAGHQADVLRELLEASRQ